MLNNYIRNNIATDCCKYMENDMAVCERGHRFGILGLKRTSIIQECPICKKHDEEEKQKASYGDMTRFGYMDDNGNVYKSDDD